MTGLGMTDKSVPKNLLHSPYYQPVSIRLLVMSPRFASSRSFTALICFLIIIFCLESILKSWSWTFLWNFMKVPMYMKKNTLNKGFALLLFTYLSVHFIMIPNTELQTQHKACLFCFGSSRMAYHLLRYKVYSTDGS